jgi:hypothetical protein
LLDKTTSQNRAKLQMAAPLNTSKAVLGGWPRLELETIIWIAENHDNEFAASLSYMERTGGLTCADREAVKAKLTPSNGCAGCRRLVRASWLRWIVRIKALACAWIPLSSNRARVRPFMLTEESEYLGKVIDGSSCHIRAAIKRAIIYAASNPAESAKKHGQRWLLLYMWARANRNRSERFIGLFAR